MIYKRKTHTKKVIALSLIIASAVGFYVASKSDSVSAQSTDLDSQMTTGVVDGPGLISVVDKIDSIKLDGSIFSDQVFVSLVDRSVELPTPILGRSNPFAPLPGTQTTSSKTSSTSR